MNWYIAYTKQGLEQKVLKALEARSFKAFLPLTRATRRKGQKVLKPLMPMYVFVQAQASGDFAAICKIKGVVSLVYRGAELVMVDEAVIGQIRHFLEAHIDVKVEKTTIDETGQLQQTTTPIRRLIDGRVEQVYLLERLILPPLGYVLVSEKEGSVEPVHFKEPEVEKKVV